MNTNVYDDVQVLSALRDAAREWQQVLLAFSEKGFNTKPFKDSWTAGQLADHILLSNQSVAAALEQPGAPAGRDAAARVPELAGIFLDFSTRLPAAEAIRPRRQKYEQDSLIAALDLSFAVLAETMAQRSFEEIVSHRAFGAITRLELLHFVCFHYRRHQQQLLHIYGIAEQKQYRFLSFLFHPPVLF